MTTDATVKAIQDARLRYGGWTLQACRWHAAGGPAPDLSPEDRANLATWLGLLERKAGNER
jgi:hypothetical protein